MIEKTLVLIKPDGVQRGIIGKIISRFEDVGLKIIAMKMLHPTKDLAESHYHLDEDWAKSVYEKTKKAYGEGNKEFNYKDHLELGKTIQSWNMDFLCEGPVVAMIIEGPHSIELVRKMIGSTEPKQASPGTIRGDFASIESYSIADKKARVLRNLIHASDSPNTAEREISLWFKNHEIQDYKKELDKHF